MIQQMVQDCQKCKGTGIFINPEDICNSCSGKGYTVKAAQLEMKMVAEGYIATKKAYLLNLNSKKKAKTPIIDATYKILFEKRSAKKIFKDLSDTIS